MHKIISTTVVFALIFTIMLSQLYGQVKYTVVTAGNSFSPSDITINAGDTIEWINTGGSHNVNGTIVTNPSNPASFGNSVGSGWVYTFVFNIVGIYNYRCDPHAAVGMLGRITVNNTTGINILVNHKTDIDLFPNPSTGILKLINTKQYSLCEIIDITGSVVYRVPIEKTDVDLTNFSKGLYFLKAQNNGRTAYKKFILN